MYFEGLTAVLDPAYTYRVVRPLIALISLSKRFYKGRANGTQLAVSLSGIPERPYSERE